MPHWVRILLGGIGCFLLGWAGLGFAGKLGGLPLWFADALLIFLVLNRSGSIVAVTVLAGALGVFAAHLLDRQPLLMAAAAALATATDVLLARALLARFAPAAVKLESAGALVRLLSWSALLPPFAGALLAGLGAIAAGRAELAISGFADWWCAATLGTTVLLPPMLAFANPGLSDPKLLQGRGREALCVLALVLLIAVLTHPQRTGLPLFLGLPLVMWAGLRFDFRTTSAFCLMVTLISVVAASMGVWPLYVSDDGVIRALQAYLLAVILPALFASLLTQEQRTTNAARLAALQALQAVMDAVPSAVMTVTQGGKVGLWSRGAERIFGWRKAEVEGREPPFAAPEHAAHDASLKARVLTGNEIQNQPAQRRDQAGELRDLLINAAPQRDADGGITGIISVMEDVTDRRRLEASREEHRANLSAILDAVADPIITSDEQGIITSFSRAAEAVFGYTAAEAIGRNLNMLMPEPYHSRHDSYLRRYRETGVTHIIGTNRRVSAQRKDGSTFPAEITISEAWLDGRRIFAGLVRDLSAKPAAAEKPEHAPAADRDQAQFLSRIVHDLRQPLHALTLVSGALERRAADPDTREIVDHLSRIVRSIQGTFENIAEWTRLEQGLVAAVPAAVPAGEILASLCREFEAEAERRGLSLRQVPSHAVILCDPALVRRILRQLLDNAMKFTPAGTVLLGARRHGPALRIVVADSGIGIAPDQQEFVFGAYNQLDAGREAGGLGLGLAIAQRLAALAGVALGLRSTPGRGSQVWVEVPLA